MLILLHFHVKWPVVLNAKIVLLVYNVKRHAQDIQKT